MHRRIFTISIMLALTTPPLSSVLAAEKHMESNQKIIKEIEPKDIQWLEKSEKIGLELLTYYANTSKVTPNNLDVAFRKWKDDKSDGRAPDKIVAPGFGVLFGNYIVRHKNCRWVVVKDSFGTDLAILTPDGQELYPISSVWKRIDPKNDDIKFFEPIWTLLAEPKMKSR